jgi:CHASE3 domain sensor protein
MKSLYELTADYKQVLSMLDDEEVDFEMVADTLESIEESINDKAENYAKLIRKFEAEEKAIKEEAKRLTDRAKTSANRAERLKTALSERLKHSDIQKVEGKIFTISFRNSTAVNVVDQTLIPDELMRIVPETKAPDKMAIAERLKAGEVVAGCELQTNQSLQIK